MLKQDKMYRQHSAYRIQGGTLQDNQTICYYWYLILGGLLDLQKGWNRSLMSFCKALQDIFDSPRTACQLIVPYPIVNQSTGELELRRDSY